MSIMPLEAAAAEIGLKAEAVANFGKETPWGMGWSSMLKEGSLR